MTLQVTAMEISININTLPIVDFEKKGFPWTEGSPPQYFDQNLPKITIITPSYNQGQYIEETIRSVLLQGYPNLEYIIIDGGSTDNTVDIIKKYEPWITYWVSEKDNGQSHAINKGLERATGDVFNWLNSDDFYLPNALLTVGRAFRDDKNLNVYCARENHKSSTGYDYTTEGTIICDTLEETIATAHNNQPPTFFKLDIVKKLGGIREDLYFCMDADLWVNYLVHYGIEKGIKKDDFITNVFRIHDDAKSTKDTHIYFKDRFNILLALANSLTHVHFPTTRLEKNAFYDNHFKRKYVLSAQINQKRLAVCIVEKLMQHHVQQLSWLSFIQLYFYALIKMPFNRKKRFYLSPLIKIRRILNA
jgi:glycosyltransferase involved in cell wall biosynthesis